MANSLPTTAGARSILGGVVVQWGRSRPAQRSIGRRFAGTWVFAQGSDLGDALFFSRSEVVGLVIVGASPGKCRPGVGSRQIQGPPFDGVLGRHGAEPVHEVGVDPRERLLTWNIACPLNTASMQTHSRH